EQYEAGATMIRLGWGSTNPAYRHFFTSTFMPHATAAQSDSFDELQRLCVTTDNALKIWKMNSVVDVSNLASKITVPTLVLHYRGDRVVPMEEGRRMAAMIPGAQFIQLEGDNHIPLEGSPGFDELFETIDRFVGEHAD
ncbi:MAG: alpha/beta hydrolase, partial [Pseudomonadota bacterium]